jgi:hypothetical protein
MCINISIGPWSAYGLWRHVCQTEERQAILSQNSLMLPAALVGTERSIARVGVWVCLQQLSALTAWCARGSRWLPRITSRVQLDACPVAADFGVSVGELKRILCC